MKFKKIIFEVLKMAKANRFSCFDSILSFKALLFNLLK